MNDRKIQAEIPEVSLGLPFVGNLLALRRDPLGLLRAAADVDGGAARMRFGVLETVFLTDAAAAHSVLVTQAAKFNKHTLYDLLREVLRDGLLTSEGEVHRRQRKLIGPEFQPARIAQYASLMVTHAERALSRWPEATPVDFASEMMRLTLGIVAEALFSSNVEDESRELGEALTELNRRFAGLVALPIVVPGLVSLRGGRALRYVDAQVRRIMAARKAVGVAAKQDLLGMLLGTGIGDERTRDEALTLFLAGHETTATALAWTLYLVARHPDVQSRLEAEVDAVLGGRSVALADLPRMPYTVQVIKEAMRLYPPAYVVGRRAMVDVDVAGRRIREGQGVMIDIFHMHRRADYFVEPERFDPERFGPGREEQIPSGAYLPFGRGPRVCVGNHFAMLEAQIILATIIARRRIELSNTETVTPEPLVTLRPRGGIVGYARAREGTPGASMAAGALERSTCPALVGATQGARVREA